MYGSGFLTHLGKDRFKVSNAGIGRDIKEIHIKLLKKDMQDILKKYGRDDVGKKEEVIRKFVVFMKQIVKPPPAVRPRAKPKPPSKLAETEARIDRMIKKLENREPIEQEFTPLEEAMPKFQSKNIKITPFTPLEEAMPQFQSKNIKIKKPIDFIPLEEAIPTKKIHKAKIDYNAIVPYVPKPQPPKPAPKPAPKPQFNYEADKKRFKSKDPYVILGVNTDLTKKELDTEYRRLSLLYHPDKYKGGQEYQEKINEAYKNINDVAKRLDEVKKRQAQEQEKFNLIDKKKLDEDFKNSLKIITDSKAKGKTYLKRQLKFFKTWREKKFTESIRIQARRDYAVFRQALIDNGLQEIVELADTLFFMREML